MDLSQQALSILVFASLAGVVVLAGLVIFLSGRLTNLRQAYASALDPDRREDVFEAVQRQAGEVERLREDLGIVHANTETLREHLRGALSRVGVVRYDAFEDMGGALSFSAALLDGDGHGVVVSAINGRSETRCYAKPVRSGSSDHNLSVEESAAIEAAMTAPRGAPQPVPSRRRRRAS